MEDASGVPHSNKDTNIEITICEVQEKLRLLIVTKSGGLGNLYLSILKELAPKIATYKALTLPTQK